MKRYTANVTQGDDYWIVEVPEIGHSTQARNADEIELMARDLISIMTEQLAYSFDLSVRFAARR